MVYAAKIKLGEEILDVLISEFNDTENLPEGIFDEDIFFYGLSKDSAEKAAKSGELCENEWVILEVTDGA